MKNIYKIIIILNIFFVLNSCNTIELKEISSTSPFKTKISALSLSQPYSMKFPDEHGYMPLFPKNTIFMQGGKGLLTIPSGLYKLTGEEKRYLFFESPKPTYYNYSKTSMLTGKSKNNKRYKLYEYGLAYPKSAIDNAIKNNKINAYIYIKLPSDLQSPDQNLYQSLVLYKPDKAKFLAPYNTFDYTDSLKDPKRWKKTKVKPVVALPIK